MREDLVSGAVCAIWQTLEDSQHFGVEAAVVRCTIDDGATRRGIVEAFEGAEILVELGVTSIHGSSTSWVQCATTPSRQRCDEAACIASSRRPRAHMAPQGTDGQAFRCNRYAASEDGLRCGATPMVSIRVRKTAV